MEGGGFSARPLFPPHPAVAPVPPCNTRKLPANLPLLRERDADGNTPLDIAIDYGNRGILRKMLQYDLRNETIMQALGNLLSRYGYIGSRELDEDIFLFLCRKKRLEQGKCTYLFRRACDGCAWPFVIPFYRCSDTSGIEPAACLWQRDDNPVLCRFLIRVLEQTDWAGVFDETVFRPLNKTLSVSFADQREGWDMRSWLSRRRKMISRRMKKEARNRAWHRR